MQITLNTLSKINMNTLPNIIKKVYQKIKKLWQKPSLNKTKSICKEFVSSKELALLAIPITKNTAISSNFLVWKFCGKAQFPHCFGKSSETMRKLCLSTKCPNQEIRRNYGFFSQCLSQIFRSV